MNYKRSFSVFVLLILATSGPAPAVLAQQFGIKPDAWEESLPDWPNISEVSSEADRTDMKERKKAWKAAQA